MPGDEVVARLCTADVCVNPDPKNAFNDAYVMNKILEYMSLGRPIAHMDEGGRAS